MAHETYMMPNNGTVRGQHMGVANMTLTGLRAARQKPRRQRADRRRKRDRGYAETEAAANAAVLNLR